jgi:transcriptional regulator with XRE-family HTH domain
VTAQTERASVLPVNNAESLEELLEHGPFAAALRSAIAARGLSLDRIQDHLLRRGIKLSIATLSYWQSGQRRPERPASLRALKHIEVILGLPTDALSALLGPANRRENRGLTEAAPAITDLWPRNPAVADLLAGVPTQVDTSMRRLTQHDRVTLGPDGRIMSMRCTQLMRADRDGADHFLFVFDWEGQGHSPPVVTNLRNCRLGRVVFNTMKGLFAGEFLFERPLRRGETVLIEYEFRNPTRNARPRKPSDSYSRRFGRPIREYVLEMCFDKQALPRQCQHFASQLEDEEPKLVRNLHMGVSNSVLAIGRDFGPGYFGVHWRLGR